MIGETAFLMSLGATLGIVFFVMFDEFFSEIKEENRKAKVELLQAMECRARIIANEVCNARGVPEVPKT